MKFSIIIPVYNVEQYIEKCLDSIVAQTYNNYEVIIVDDGSPDNSASIIKKYIKGRKNFKYYKKTNGGLSDARNYGLQYVTGDYILFVDSDDYLNSELLSNLNTEIVKTNADVVKFNLFIVNDEEKTIARKADFSNLNNDDAIKIILKDEFVEPAWMYCYRKDFWIDHKFNYAKGRLHEDFGLTPLVLMNAKNVSSIPYIGYNYVIRSDSIMTVQNPEKNLKKYKDCLFFVEHNINEIEKCDNISDYTKQLLKSYYANGILNRLKTLSKDDYERELKHLKELRIFDYLMSDTILRKIKKMLYKNFTSIFIKCGD